MLLAGPVLGGRWLFGEPELSRPHAFPTEPAAEAGLLCGMDRSSVETAVGYPVGRVEGSLEEGECPLWPAADNLGPYTHGVLTTNRGLRMVKARWALGGAVAVALLAGCSGAAEAEPSASPEATDVSSTPTATPNPSPSADDEAAVLDVFGAYWEATVAAQRGNPDPGLFEGVATGPIVEEAVAAARQFEEYGIVREGEPTFSQITVEVEGDEATAFACVDNSEWVVPGVEDDVDDVLPGGLVFERRGDTWLVTDRLAPPASFTC